MKRLVGFLLAVGCLCAALPGAAAVPDRETLDILRAARTVRLVIDQSYYYRPRNQIRREPIPGFSLDLASLVTDLLSDAGVAVVGADAAAFDATLRLTIRGDAVGRTYREGLLGHFYAGAMISGEIAVWVPGTEPWRTPLRTRLMPPLEIRLNFGYEQPANAPFGEAIALPGSFLPRFMEVAGLLYGPAPLANVLESGSPAARRSAAGALGDLGDPAATGPLVAALTDPDPDLRRDVAWALGRIGDPRARGPLSAALSDPDSDVRWFAGWALEQIEERLSSGSTPPPPGGG